MKIALLSQSYPPMVSGAAVVTKGIAEHMANRNHQVLVLTSSESPFPYTINKKNLLVKRFRSQKNLLRVGQRFTLWPHSSIMAALQSFSPDIIHAHDPFQFALSGLAYARKARIPVVFTAHQVPSIVRSYSPDRRITGSLVERCMWAYSRRIGKRFSLITAPTRTIADLISSRTGILPAAIPFGIDTALFHTGPLNPDEDDALRAELGVPPGAQILLHVGRLDMDKKVDLVIQAAVQAMINEQTHLLIAGDGTEKSRLIQLTKRLGMSERTHFPGFVDRQGILPGIYRMASIFITASETETQGLVLLEAAACGLPIVAVNATCIPEIVHAGENGYLAPPGDVDCMARYISCLLEDPSLSESMGQAGARIARGLDIQHSIDAYEAAYYQAVKLSQQISFSPTRAWQARAKHSGVSD